MSTVSYELAEHEEATTVTSPRRWLKGKHRLRLNNELPEAPPSELQQPAMVFAPHQDDETLGCGGTILRKRALDADVDVVFLTDGSTSHRHLMSPLMLSALREEEAMAACAKLSVAADRISFLRYPDGSLKDIGDVAARTILHLIRERQPREIYIPYASDPQPDHRATNSLVRTVLKASGIRTTILEYPVWAWYQWPWVSISSLGSGRNIRQVLANTLKFSAGLRLVRDMNYRVAIDDMRSQKLIALQEHRTQMTRINEEPNWATLHDVAGGAWLEYFLQRNEIFHRYEI